MSEATPTTPLTMTFVLGLPGSGKSSLVAKRQLAGSTETVICFDTIRRALGHEYSPCTEPFVACLAGFMARVALLSGKSVVIDESITLASIATQLVAIAREYGAEVVMMHVNTPLQRCWANRVPHGFPQADFDRKVIEWADNMHEILGLADRFAEPEIL